MNTLEEMKMQIAQLNMWTKAYDEGHPMVSDKEWDTWYFRLLDFENRTGIRLSNSPTQSIDYQVVNKLTKVEHNHPMLSLAKTKDIADINDFLGHYDFIAMCKLDGLTCSLHYENGKLIGAETRGNSIIGEDILHNAKVVRNIPNRIAYQGELIVDGEIICTYEDFKPYQEEYKHPRNFASGSIRLLDAKECATRNLTFVAWDIIKGFEELAASDYLHNRLIYLEENGFTIVPYIGNDGTTLEEDVETIKELAQQYGYPIDGVVFKYESQKLGNQLGRTDHHFKNAMAFKFYDEEFESELLDIEWSMSRNGTLTPVAVYSDIEIDGTICNRASLHNINIMHEILGPNPYVGQKVWVAKKNQIIPQIVRSEYE